MDSLTSDKQSTDTLNRRRLLQTSVVSVLSGVGLTLGTSSVAAQTNETDDTNETNTNDTDSTDSEDTATQDDSEEAASCEGAPSMSRTSITTPSSKITTEDPAVVEANFRPDPTIPEDCTIMVDLEFSFTDSGFQWGGGSNWDQAASDFVVGTFEVDPGEIRSIQGELHTQGAEAGDQVTVQADYEVWFEGNREESRQQSGIRHTIAVESPNPPEDDVQSTTENASEEDPDVSIDATPGFGIGTTVASLGGAGYMIKSKLENESE